MSWEALKLDRTWDMRWDADQAEDAVGRADDQVLRAHANLGRAFACVQQATEQYTDAVRWADSARTLSRKFLPEIPDPPAAPMTGKDESA